MKKVELIPGMKASVIGFGCAPIMGSVNSKTAKYALEMAFEHGVNYLDVARSYGYGEAEGFIGKVIKDRRDQIYVATKFGIVPNWKAGVLKPMKPLVRYLKNFQHKKNFPAKTNEVSSSELSNRFLDRLMPLRSQDMRKSLEKSLKQLKRDYVDSLLIHAPHHTLEYFEELYTTAELLKKEGKIKVFGLALMHSQENYHKNYFEKFDLLQYDNPMIRDDYKDFVSKNRNQASVIFSPFKSLNMIKPTESLKKLLMDFPNSVVLCSMFNPDHIKQNIKVALDMEKIEKKV